MVWLYAHTHLLFAYPDFPIVFLTTMPAIFADIYHERPGIAGLHYFALGIGLSSASQINARFMDRIYIHFKNKNGGVGEPEFRLRELSILPLFNATVLMPTSPSVNGPWKYHASHWTAAFGMVGTTSLALDSNRHCAFISGNYSKSKV